MRVDKKTPKKRKTFVFVSILYLRVCYLWDSNQKSIFITSNSLFFFAVCENSSVGESSERKVWK